MHRARAAAVSVLLASLAAVPVAAGEADPAAVVRDAMARAVAIPAQAEALAKLAWPDSTAGVDPAVSAEARKVLVDFGGLGLAAIRESIRRAEPRYCADVVRAFLEARDRVESGIPQETIPALDDALWFGTPDAQRIAMRELARLGYGPALLPTIDAAIASPDLALDAIRSLGALGDDRARFWLESILQGDDDALRVEAAAALARIRGRALIPLKNAMRGDRKELRELAASALVPVAGAEDLTALYEYVADHADDDPAVVAAVRNRAAKIEEMLDAFAAAQSASPRPD